jgi:hypothetical protein
MKYTVFILALIVTVISSCTTAYKTGQTPDDVYYSPVRPQDEYVRVEKEDDRYYQGSEDYYTDRYLRMRMLNRSRWSYLDDYYFNNAYAYNYYGASNWNSPWNNYWTWNNYCNPYYGGVVIVKNPTRYTPPSRAVAFNPNSYINNNTPAATRNVKGVNSSYYNNSYNTGNGASTRYNNSNSSSTRSTNNSNNYNNTSNSRSSSNNNSYTPSNSTPTRSYTPSSGSSSSSNSSGNSSSSNSSSSSTPSRPPR